MRIDPIQQRFSFEDDELSHAIAEALILARKKRTSWDRLLTITATIISIAAIIFAAGINWSKIGQHELKVNELQLRIEKLENESNNQGSDLKVMKTQLDIANQNLVEIKSAIYLANRQGYPAFSKK